MAKTYFTRICPACGTAHERPSWESHVIYCSCRCARLSRPKKETSERFWSHISVRGPDECWLWISAAVSRGGYGTFNVGGKMVAAHRFAWELVNGPIPEGMCACHRCDTPACCNPSHLFLGSIGDNHADMVAKGRQPIGEKHANARLSDAQVIAIRVDPRLQREIAAQYGISQPCVSEIKRGIQRRHVA